ncbi:MAG: hypothetical protein RL322_554 [Pseudomonadota bacterium]|jgi:carbon-monoxide dehydrogenase large subunit
MPQATAPQPIQAPTFSRREDARLITGRGEFADDQRVEGALYCAFVRSPFASARIGSIDVQAALALPGVIAVLTGRDFEADGWLDCAQPFRFPQGDGSFAEETPRPFLIRDRVRFVGEPVAMVIAQDAFTAQDGAEQVLVDYAEQAVASDIDHALSSDAPLVWDSRPGNIAFDWRGGASEDRVEAALAASAHRVYLRSPVTRVAAMPLEPRAAAAWIGEDGRPVLHLSHQSPHQIRNAIAPLFKLDPKQIRIITTDVGGSFGMKSGPLREEVLVLWATLRLKRPVRWTASRSESFLSDEHGRDVMVSSELGLDAEGRFTALRVLYDVNLGAYMTPRSTAPVGNIVGITGVYRTPVIGARIRGVLTHTQTTAAYRGAGRPDATYAIERVIDLAAGRLGIDPAELRRRNLIQPTELPWTTAFGSSYDSGDFPGNLERALEQIDYSAFPKRREASERRGRLRGIGLAMPIEMAGRVGGDWARVEVASDGSIIVVSGAKAVGQGHETMFAKLIADKLGVDANTIRYQQGDTDLLENGRGNGGSSAMMQGGSALTRAADDLIDKGRIVAASELEVSPEDLEFADGQYRVRGTDLELSFRGLVGRLVQMAQASTLLQGAGSFTSSDGPTFPNGCHICEVEIDPETGYTTLINYVTVEDVGTVLNPVMVEGQIHGGVAQGLGQAFFEQLRYDHAAQLQSASFMDYALPRASDMPPILSLNPGTPTARNPLSVKGVGEAGTVGALSAGINAVCNALAGAGIEHLDMPATPHRIWEALDRAGYFERAERGAAVS